MYALDTNSLQVGLTARCYHGNQIGIVFYSGCKEVDGVGGTSDKDCTGAMVQCRHSVEQDPSLLAEGVLNSMVLKCTYVAVIFCACISILCTSAPSLSSLLCLHADAPSVYHGTPLTDRKSTFQAHVAQVHSKNEVSLVDSPSATSPETP